MDQADTAPDPRVRQDALQILTDLLEWHLTTEEWQAVARVLEDMETAVHRGDDETLDSLTANLEALSPYRIAPIDLTYPVPLPLRLRDNILIHTLTDEATRPPAPRPAAPVTLPPGDTRVREEYVVHAFAPMDGPWTDPAYQQIRRLWSRAAEILTATAALGDPAVPMDPPADVLQVPADPLLAARQRPDGTAQMVLRREHDALILSIGWRSAPGWAHGEDQWARISEGGADDLLGVARLRVGTGEIPAGEPRVAAGACTLWELPPFDDHGRPQRSLLVLAPHDQDAALSTLVWSDGSPALPPLARYLLDAAKIRYELRVRAEADPALRAAVTSGIEPDLVNLMSRLDDLRHTVGIARANLAEILRTIDADTTEPAGLFADDLRTAEWLDQRLEDDLRYLTNARQRSGHSTPYATPEPAIGLITALPEEYAAMAALLDDATEPTVTGDDAPYRLGTLPSFGGQPHPAVLTLLGTTATVDAAATVAHLVRSFPTVSHVIMVGTAAGIPAPQRPPHHVRLGDIVVATWGIADYDHVVDRPEGTTPRAFPPRPSYGLGRQAAMLRADELLTGHRPWEEHLDRLTGSLPAFSRPPETTDILYASDEPDATPINHPPRDASGHRPGHPKVHHGRIGSANRSLRNAEVRDELAQKYQMRAIEMEGSGIAWSSHASSRDWLVIRGISDYADSRTGPEWRMYASAAAAAYTRALLGRCPTINPARA